MVPSSRRRRGEDLVTLRIPGAGDNKADGMLFRADIWFCSDPAEPARGYNRVTIDKNGRFTSEDANGEGEGGHANQVVGYVVGEGFDVAWDTSRPRSAAAVSTRGGGDAFKSEVEIGADNRIRTKAYSTGGQGGGHRMFAVTEFSGASAFDVRLPDRRLP
jgi:hypothetical protein